MTATLAQALVAVQQEMPAITPDAVNPHFRNQYVSLDHLLAKALPVLNKHGVALIQLPSHNELGHPTLTTRLMHESGDFIEQSMPLFLPKNDPQGQGSAITYARRYAAAAALGISGERDDDGEAGSAAGERQTNQELAAQGVSRAAPSGQGERPQAGAAAAAPAAHNGGGGTAGFVLKYGPHANKTLAEVPRDYIDQYLASEKGSGFVKDKMREFLAAGGTADALDDIPFDRTGDGTL